MSIFLSLCACAKKNNAIPINSWWLDTEYKPDCESGSNAHFTTDKGCYMLLTRDIVAASNHEHLKDIDSVNFTFRSELSLTPSDKAIFLGVGVYLKEGKKGRFLVVAGDSNFEDVYKIFHKAGDTGFSALNVNEGVVDWYFCVNCGDRERLIVTDAGYFLE